LFYLYAKNNIGKKVVVKVVNFFLAVKNVDITT